MMWNRKRYEMLEERIDALSRMYAELGSRIKDLENRDKVCSKCRCVFSPILDYTSLHFSIFSPPFISKESPPKAIFLCSRCKPIHDKEQEIADWARNNVDKITKCMKKAACPTNSGKHKRGAKKS